MQWKRKSKLFDIPFQRDAENNCLDGLKFPADITEKVRLVLAAPLMLGESGELVVLEREKYIRLSNLACQGLFYDQIFEYFSQHNSLEIQETFIKLQSQLASVSPKIGEVPNNYGTKFYRNSPKIMPGSPRQCLLPFAETCRKDAFNKA